MLIDLQKLLDERMSLVTAQRELLDAAEAEERGLNADEKTTYEKMEARFDELTEKIEREQKLRSREERMAEIADVAIRPEPEQGQEDPEQRTAAEMRGFRSYLMGQTAVAMEVPEYRALQADSDVAGGYTVAPQQFVRDLIKAMDNLVYIRKLATVYPVTSADSLGVVSLDNDPADPAWTKEIGTGTEDSTMSFGGRSLHPHPLAKRLKVSRTLLRKSALDVDQIVRDRLAYKNAVTLENAYLNGTGAEQPLGVFTANANGISTSRDISTNNTTTAITADNLINCKYALKSQYWKNATWIFHRDAMKMIRKLKTESDGQYIWQPGLRGDRQDTLLDVPVVMSEYAPNTFTAGLYAGIIGDFSKYWIADSLQFEIQRLEELYAATNQVGFISRMETDGMPVLEEAFVRVTLASS